MSRRWAWEIQLVRLNLGSKFVESDHLLRSRLPEKQRNIWERGYNVTINLVNVGHQQAER